MNKINISSILVLLVICILSTPIYAVDENKGNEERAQGVVYSFGGIVGLGIFLRCNIDDEKVMFILDNDLAKKHGMLKEEGHNVKLTNTLEGKEVEFLYDKNLKSQYGHKYYNLIELKVIE